MRYTGLYPLHLRYYDVIQSCGCCSSLIVCMHDVYQEEEEHTYRVVEHPSAVCRNSRGTLPILIPWYTGVPLSRYSCVLRSHRSNVPCPKLSEEKRSMPLPRPDEFLVGPRALQLMRYSDRVMNHSSTSLVPVQSPRCRSR